MRRLIAVRRQFKAFGRGTWEPLDADHRRVLVFLRRFDEETILCVANLSRFAQYVELDLRRFEGCVPVELWSNSAFPRIGELPYLLTLGPHNFMWFQLAKREDISSEGRLRVDWREHRRETRGERG